MSGKVEQLEVESDASSDLALTASDVSLDDHFLKLELGHADGQTDALSALMAKMGLLPASEATPAAVG